MLNKLRNELMNAISDDEANTDEDVTIVLSRKDAKRLLSSLDFAQQAERCCECFTYS